MYDNISFAHRYNETLTVDEIAQLIRGQIAEEVKAGELPVMTYEVVVPEEAAHIEVTIRGYTGSVYNKRSIELEDEIRKGVLGLGFSQYETLLLEKMTTPELDLDLDRLLKAVSRISNQWRYEDGNPPNEHPVYTSRVIIDSETSYADYVKVIEEIELEKITIEKK